jgi:arylsulfatase
VVLLVCLFVSAQVFAQRTNVVVILVDDMGWSDIGCYGSEIATPHLDQLAANGLRFTQFYNTGRCSPTRASLLTGHYPHQAGMGHLDDRVLADHPGFKGRILDSSVTIAEVLKSAGYFTATTGKWHLGYDNGTTPQNRGFDRSLNLKRGGVHFPNQTLFRSDAKLYLNGEEHAIGDPMFGGDKWYGAELWSDWGLKFIDEAIEKEQPFFLYLAHAAPHFPLMARQADIDRYRGKYLTGWDELRNQRHQRQIEMGLVSPKWPLTPLPNNTPAWTDVPLQKRDRFDHIMSIYAAMIESMDRSVGTVVDGLEQRGLLDNTLILFVSDNGGNAESGPDGKYEGDNPGDRHSNVFLGQNWATLNNTPFRRYKHYVHEGGIATPLIAHWPEGIDQQLNGKLDHSPGHVIDIMSTIVAATGATYPQVFNGHRIEPASGVSLTPAFQGKPITRDEPIFFNHEDNSGVRDGKWKLVALKGQPWELYDIEADRTELHDLASAAPQRVKEMSAAYDAWAIATRVVKPGEDPESVRQPKKNQQNQKNKKNKK